MQSSGCSFTVQMVTPPLPQAEALTLIDTSHTTASLSWNVMSGIWMSYKPQIGQELKKLQKHCFLKMHCHCVATTAFWLISGRSTHWSLCSLVLVKTFCLPIACCRSKKSDTSRQPGRAQQPTMPQLGFNPQGHPPQVFQLISVFVSKPIQNMFIHAKKLHFFLLKHYLFENMS